MSAGFFLTITRFSRFFEPFFSCFSRFSGKYIASFQGFQLKKNFNKALRFSQHSEFFETEIHVRKFQSIKTIYSKT